MRRLWLRFVFAWSYAYETAKWQAFMRSPESIKHFDRAHFTAVTAQGRKFVYCPVGNICSWSEGDYDHKWCHWCKKFFNEIGA